MTEGVMDTAGAQAPAVFALQAAHHLEVRLLQTRIERLEAVLREHGIPSPDHDPRLGTSDFEHLKQCQQVVRAAYDLLDQLEGLRTMVGSGAELLRQEGWRAGTGGPGVHR